MAMTEKKRKPKSAGTRTEVFAMRLDPKLKYLAEVAARKQRRSLANFIEWALEQALGGVSLMDSGDSDGRYSRSVLDEASKLWDLEPSDRFIKLATNYPDLLNYEEQLIWKAIFDVSANEAFKGSDGKTEFIHYDFVDDVGGVKQVDRVIVKECWQELVGYAGGTVTLEELKAALLNTVPF
jgi:hypothetical protein